MQIATWSYSYCAPYGSRGATYGECKKATLKPDKLNLRKILDNLTEPWQMENEEYFNEMRIYFQNSGDAGQVETSGCIQRLFYVETVMTTGSATC
jgi:hypothetical protein